MAKSKSKEPTVYECENPNCTLGSREGPGYFTGGITEEQAAMLLGMPPEEVVAGDGICPNCGQEGTEV